MLSSKFSSYLYKYIKLKIQSTITMDDEFDENINALRVPEVPDDTQSIINDIKSYDYPITASFIGKHIGKTKSETNKKLYKMMQIGLVEKLDCIPPLWRVV